MSELRSQAPPSGGAQQVTIAPGLPEVVGLAPGRRLRIRRAALTPFAFLVVPISLYLMWVIGPMIYTFYMSFTNSDGITQQDWIGLRNYRRMLDDSFVRTAFFNNIRWLVAYITIPIAGGLGLALLLNNQLAGTRIFKASIFSPMVVSSVVIANVWSWIYFPHGGLINDLLMSLGLTERPINFLGNPKTATWAIIAAGLWRQIGYVMLLYLAGLKNVDPTLVDASRVDGASRVQTFRDVVLPLLQPITVIVLVISIIDALRSFDLVNLMTDGGPFGSSTVLSHRMYEEAFNNYNMGYAAAIAVVLMMISAVFIFTYLLRMVRRELEY